MSSSPIIPEEDVAYEKVGVSGGFVEPEWVKRITRKSSLVRDHVIS